MSVYIRTIPSKFVTFVNIRKQVTQIERQLPKHVPSAFLHKFLDTQATICTATSITRKTKEYADVYSLNQDLSPIDSNTFSQNAAFQGYNSEKRQSTYLDRQKLMNFERIHNSKSTEIYRKTLTSHNNRASNKVNFLSKQMDDSLSEEMLSFTDGVNSSPVHNKPVEGKNTEKPSQEQLQQVYECLRKDIPKLFIQTMNYRMYHENIIFINNIKGTTTVGINNYMKQIILLRAVAHIKFAYVVMEVLKMTIHPEDGSIKVRWRIKGVSGIRAILTFWKYKMWRSADALREEESWIDGFSEFYVGSDGKIYKHIADKMMPNQNIELDQKEKAPIATKLALFSGMKELYTYTFNQYSAKRGISDQKFRTIKYDI